MDEKRAMNWYRVCEVASRRAWTGGPLEQEDLVQAGVLGALEGESIPEKAKGAYENMYQDIERLYDEPLMAPLEHARYDAGATADIFLAADQDPSGAWLRDQLSREDGLARRIRQAYDDEDVGRAAAAASMGSTYSWMTDECDESVIDDIQADEQRVERPWDRVESREYVDEVIQHLFKTGRMWDIADGGPGGVDASWISGVVPPVPRVLDVETDANTHHDVALRWWNRGHPPVVEMDDVAYSPLPFDVDRYAQGKLGVKGIRFTYNWYGRKLSELETARLTIAVARIVAAGKRTQGEDNADEYKRAVIDSVMESMGPDGSIDDEVWDRVDPDWGAPDHERFRLDVKGSVDVVHKLASCVHHDLREPDDVTYDMVSQTYKGWQEWDTKEGMQAAIRAMFIEFASPNGVQWRAKQAFWQKRPNARNTMKANNEALKKVGLMRVKAFKYAVVPRTSIPVKTLLPNSRRVRDVWGRLHPLKPGMVLSVEADKADLLTIELSRLDLAEDVAVYRAS